VQAERTEATSACCPYRQPLAVIKEMKRAIIILILGLVPSLVFSQEKTGKIPMKLILSPGMSYQGKLLGELSLMFSKLDMTSGGAAIWGPRFGFESSLTSNDYIFAPKIGYEISGLMICLRGNGLAYLQNKKSDFRLLPEAGLSLSGAINLTYGYNLHIYGDKIRDIANHKFSLLVNLNCDLWKVL